MRRRVSIFGSTGSVGCSTVDLLIRQGGREAYDVVALTGAGNIKRLAEQARALGARVAVTADPGLLAPLRAALEGSGTEAMAGPQALLEAADRPTDWAMSAIIGVAGLAPGLRLARHGGVLALANKESVVCAGDLLIRTCTAHGTRLIPVDSEHNAIHQALEGQDHGALDRIILTASGGPFRDWPRARMAGVTPEQAMAHPNWDMGDRISIDSATFFNKALEVIEAKHLFGVDAAQIEVLVHPQSIIHSMVGFTDGALLAHLGPPDMRGAIGHALNHPERQPLPLERLDLGAIGRLDFAPVDRDRFPALDLAYDVLAAGGLSGAVFNGAKEAALDAFINRDISFLDMAQLVGEILSEFGPTAAAERDDITLENVLEYDSEARARLWHKVNRHAMVT